MDNFEEGYIAGDKCGRDGCSGTIQLRDTDTCCSCHSNPPCSHCTTPREYCDVCEWDAQEEQNEQDRLDRLNFDQKAYDQRMKVYEEQERQFQEAKQLFYDRFYGRKPIEGYQARIESHTHFSQKVYGVHPVGFEIPMDKIRGTFGGRFELKDKTRFIYIAYTD